MDPILYAVILVACMAGGYFIGSWRSSKKYKQAISNIIKRKGHK